MADENVDSSAETPEEAVGAVEDAVPNELVEISYEHLRPQSTLKNPDQWPIPRQKCGPTELLQFGVMNELKADKSFPGPWNAAD